MNTSFRFVELALQPAHDRHGLVGGGAVGDDHLEPLAREVLREQHAQRALDRPRLVPHGDDDGDGRHGAFRSSRGSRAMTRDRSLSSDSRASVTPRHSSGSRLALVELLQPEELQAGREQDVELHPRRAVADVEEVVHELVLHAPQARVRRKVDLREAGDAGLHRVAAVVARAPLRAAARRSPAAPAAGRSGSCRPSARSTVAAVRRGAACAARGRRGVIRGSPGGLHRGPVCRSQSWYIVRIL